MKRDGNVTICNENINEGKEIIHVDLAGMNVNQSTELLLCSENIFSERALHDSFLAITISEERARGKKRYY